MAALFTLLAFLSHTTFIMDRTAYGDMGVDVAASRLFFSFQPVFLSLSRIDFVVYTRAHG